MKSRVQRAAIILFLILTAPLIAQQSDKEAPKEKEDKEAAKKQVAVYTEAIIEDFETTPYTDKNISYNVTSDQEGHLAIRDQLPATASSKKYLGVKVKTRGDDVFIIKPAKDWIIDKHCKSISFWIYGKNTRGILSFLLMDTKQQNHLINIATIDFVGWKKITVPITKKIAQEDAFLNQKKTMKILQLQYRTVANKNMPSQWQYLYLDDITATVRERYDDKQSDEW